MRILETYVALVETWQQRVNLVSPASLPDIWMRHIWDSAQLALHISDAAPRLVDVGSGAGFPGIVLAILTDAECHLVESDQKKAIFLSTVIRECGLTAHVHNQRVESLPCLEASIITARALAPLDRLLPLLATQLRPGTRCLFLKGAQAESELAALGNPANLAWRLHPSLTNPDSSVIDLSVS
ncbi:MAG: 16S rRNA (guanine(527)-N(7))-methyltransferase RsmG [Pseudomonadota bacterium]|nr:16S rRNA (guanine(527)-N(7))-methyltransferase RsmG [Pseudomonadota bacterium]